ncbi:hypothetical protein QBC39DRAFT_432019 [Podospora conica]|nr:hypothetical protein QBC39DRAFT_432019 [Schizothecium conicum]
MRTTFFLAALPILAFAAPGKQIVDDDEDCSTTAPAAITTKAPRPHKFKTSTVYATSVHTVTSCAPTVTNCPGRPGKPVVVTEVIPVSTTICPDDDDDDVKPTPAPTKPIGKPPVVDNGCSTTISTSTCVHTETTGPKDVVVTTYLPITQTICPVVPGKPTWAHPEPSHPGGGPGHPGKPGHPEGPEETQPAKPHVPGAPKPTGTGAWPAPTKPGQAVVTAGAAENMAALKMVGAAAFAALLL